MARGTQEMNWREKINREPKVGSKIKIVKKGFCHHHFYEIGETYTISKLCMETSRGREWLTVEGDATPLGGPIISEDAFVVIL